MRLTPTQQNTVRTRPQSTELYLSIFRPNIVMAAMVTGSLSRGAREIGYYNVVTGSVSNIEPGMTLLVGTSENGRELGKIRIRSGTSTQFIVSENSHIDWASATHLTALRYWEIYPVYPRITQDINDPESVTFFKDFDVPYTNQNSVLGAFPCAGNHRALFSGEQSYWSSTGTTHLLGSALTYEWAFEGGSPTGSTLQDPGYVTYNTPGHYVTRLIVRGTGTVDTTYRYVSVYNNPKNAAQNPPTRNWTLNNLGGTRGEGGYTADITITEQDVQLHDGDVVVLFSDDFYGSTNQSFGGNSPNNSKIFFVGHVVGSSIQYGYRRSSVNFQIASVTDMMKHSEGFSVSVESKASPSKWFELLDMDGRRALYHYLKWHTTVLSIADFQFLGTDQKIQFFDSDRESMFDAVDNYMRMTLLGSVCADRQGKIWAEVGAWVTPNPTGSFATIQTLEKRDWIGDVDVEERLYPDLSSIELGGVAYSGVSTGTFDAFISSAPGLVPAFRGNAETHQGLALASQDQLNELAGNYYANKTSRFPKIGMNLAGNYRQFDIAPQEAIGIVATQEETNIGVRIDAPYLIDGMSWEYNPKNKILLPSADFISLVNGSEGESVLIPEVPDAGGYAAGGNINFSPLSGFPPLLGSLFLNKPYLHAYGDPSGSGSVGSPREINWLNAAQPQDFYLNNGFSFATGTSTISTGTILNQIYAPYIGAYWVWGHAYFTNITGRIGYMALWYGDLEIYSAQVDDSSAPVSSAFFYVNGGGLVYVNNTTIPIKMSVAYNHAFGTQHGVINIFGI